MATNKLNLTRDQLATFLRDHQAIRQFELLFSVASELYPDTVDALKVEAGSAVSKAELALGMLERMASSLEVLASAPVGAGSSTPDDLGPSPTAELAHEWHQPSGTFARQEDWLFPPAVPIITDQVPVGTVVAFRFSSIPDNWLELNGQTVTTGEYPELAGLYGAGGATMVLDDWTDLPMWGDGAETQGDVVGNDDRSVLVQLSGDNTTWTGSGESVLSIANTSAITTNLTAGATAVNHTETHTHSISGGDHDHAIKTYQYQGTPVGGETTTDNAFSVLPRRAIVKWIIKARRVS